LRLFFGGSAGLTAVRTMLETAAAAQQRGADLVVCAPNAYGSGAIDGLLRGFECLPALQGSLGAKYPPRIDVDAVRKREPAILLVDTRVPSSSENGRRRGFVHSYHPWADIESVLVSGITVWAALDATGFSSWGPLWA
jgi:two-component system sensor histidine kinase KdpD